MFKKLLASFVMTAGLLLFPMTAFADIDYSLQSEPAFESEIRWGCDGGSAEFRFSKGNHDASGFASASPAGSGSETSVVVMENGTYTLYAKQGDSVMCVVVPVTNIDRTPPEIKLQNIVRNADGTATVTFDIADFFGVSDVRVLAGDHAVSEYSGAESVSGNTLSNLEAGIYTVYAADSAGNVSKYTLKVDVGGNSSQESTSDKSEWETSESYEYGANYVSVYSGLSYVMIRKLDYMTGDGLAGAKLSLVDSSGRLVKQWVTDGSPLVMVDELDPGEVYTLREDTAPDGYEVASPVTFRVNTDGTLTDVYMRDKKVSHKAPDPGNPGGSGGSGGSSDPGPARVVISKCDMVSGKEIAGAKLVITDEYGREIKSWVTNGSRTVVENVLERGKTYTLTEITAPDGYALSESVTFTVRNDGSTTEVRMYDRPLRSDDVVVRISKSDLVTGEELEGAKLVIRDEHGKEIKSWITNGKRTVIENVLERGKTYTLTEITAPDGYEIAETVTFTVRSDGSITDVVMHDRRKGYDPSKPIVRISKCDMVSGKEIAGAKLVIKDKNGKEIKSWITNGKRTIVENVLERGKTYTLTEITAPDGYEIAETVTFTVRSDGSITDVVMYDAPKKPIDRLPQTGGFDARGIAVIVAMLLMVFGAAGMILMNRRK